MIAPDESDFEMADALAEAASAERGSFVSTEQAIARAYLALRAIVRARRQKRASARENEMRVRAVFAWYDFWVGAFWDRGKRRLYVFPIPCFGFIIQFGD